MEQTTPHTRNNVCVLWQRRVVMEGVKEGGQYVSLSGRCPAPVTWCKPPIKAALNPLALLPRGLCHGGGPFVKGPSRWFKEHSYVSKTPAKYSRRGDCGGGGSRVCLWGLVTPVRLQDLHIAAARRGRINKARLSTCSHFSISAIFIS